MLPSRIFLDDFLDDLTPSKENNKMICDIYEEDGKYFIEVDVPGFKKEDIKIECDKGNLKIVAEKHSNKEEHKTNEYTDKFKGKNVIVIHTESMQNAALNTSFNGQEVTPNLNRLKNEGMYFSNYYSQASSGTSSDSEFTFATSLLPVTNGAVAISYWNREYETLQKLLKGEGYRTVSMHANTGDFWNRNNFHKNCTNHICKYWLKSIRNSPYRITYCFIFTMW